MTTGIWRRAVDGRGVRAMAVRLAAGVAMAVGLAGCTSFNKSANEGGAVVSAKERSEAGGPQHEAYASLGYRLAWRAFPDVSEGHKIVGVDPMGDTVLVRESATRVSAIDSKSGSMRWSDQLAGPLTTLVGSIRGENAIAIVSDTDVFVMDAGTGNLLNRYSLGKVTSVAPMLTEFALVVGATDGQVVAYQRQTGFRLWANSLDSLIEVPPVSTMGTAGAFVSRTGELLVVDLATGAGQSRARMHGGPTAAPAVSNDAVFVSSSDQSVYAFESRTGDQVWRFRTPTSRLGAPVYYEGVVFVDVPGSGFMALDSATGRPIWTREGVTGKVIAVVKGRLLVWDASTGSAAMVDRKDGSVFDRAKLEGVQTLVADGLVDPVLYVATTSGVLERLSPR